MDSKNKNELRSVTSPRGRLGGAVLVIKIGGNIIDDAAALDNFLEKFALIDAPKILVHGGGKLATEMATTMKIPQQMMDGRRITDEATLKLVTMVYAGFINKNIVAKLQAKSCNALGLCGADANIILAKKRNVIELDYGFVGDVVEHGINDKFLKLLLGNNITLIIAPITHNKEGQLLNTNADTIANEIAKAMSTHYEVQLIYCFDKKGVLENVADENSVIKLITKDNIKSLKENKIIQEGMIPKIDNALQAVLAGVHKVTLGHAKELIEIINNEAGTSIQ